MILREDIVSGINLTFNSGLEIKHLVVSEIKKIGFINYSNFINCFVLKPRDLIIPLWGMGIYYEDITHYQLFIRQLKNNKTYYFKLFKLFSNCEEVWIEVNDDNEEVLCYKINKNCYYLDSNSFDSAYVFFKEMTLHTHLEKRYFSGEKTKKIILDEDYEDYLEDIKTKRQDTRFSDMISFITIANHRKWEYVDTYPLGRLYEEYVKTYNREEANYIRLGISSGTYDGTKIKADKLKWFKT